MFVRGDMKGAVKETGNLCVVGSLGAYLEVDLALDGDVGATDGVAAEGHLDVGGPGGVLPLHLDLLVGAESSGEGVIITEVALPLDSDLAGAEGEGRGDAVVVVDLLGYL